MTTPISGTTASTVASAYAQAATSKTTAGTSTSGSGTSTSGSSSTSSSSGSMLSPQAFLQLLVAQLQYQDPTNPTDTSTFMNQTAMLSQVQTMNSMSSTLSGLESAQQTQAATSMIGKQVTYTDASGTAATGVADSVSLLSTGATLSVGGVSVPMSSVTSVGPAPTTHS